MRHQSEVALDQDVPRGQIALCGQLQIVPLLGGCERLWKGAAGACQMQRTEHTAEHEPDSGRKHGNLTSCKECIPRRLVQIPHFPRGQALTEAKGRQAERGRPKTKENSRRRSPAGILRMGRRCVPMQARRSRSLPLRENEKRPLCASIHKGR